MLKKPVKLSPSILNADFSDLRKVMSIIEPYADMVHLDIMDGHFVPNLTFGPMIVSTVKRLTTLPLDTHLMIFNPHEWIESFVEAGADRIALHIRSCRDLEGAIKAIRGFGVTPGLALSPEVPVFELKPYLSLIDYVVVMCVYPGFGGQPLMPEMLPRISAVKRDAKEIGVDIEVQVDGGVKYENLPMVIEAGADNLVIGSSIFGAEDPSAAAASVRALLG